MLAKELGAKALKVPDYFSEFKGRPELLGFLGGAIVAKLVFNDASASKLWISKVIMTIFTPEQEHPH